MIDEVDCVCCKELDDNVKQAFFNVDVEDPISTELIFQDSGLSFMNPHSRSEEAFFGDQNPWKLGAIAHIANFRSLYAQLKDENASKQQKDATMKNIKEECSKFELLIEREFNIEKAYLGIFANTNAFAVPLCWDKELIKIDEKKKKSVNNDFRISLEEIVETSSGFKYKDSKKKIFALGLGFGFFDCNYTDEEIAGILTHEIGHSFQQMLVGINTNLANSYIATSINNIYTLFNPFLTAITYGLTFIIGLVEGVTLGKLKNTDDDEIAEDIVIHGMGSASSDYDREKIGSDLNDMTTKSLKQMKKMKKKGFWYFIGKFFLGIISGTILTGKYILYPFYYLVNIPRHILLGTNMNFLKQNRRFEQFADMFAANYGLGKELSSALAKLGEEYHRLDLATLNWINFIPVLNLVINVGYYTEQSVSGLLAGYPDMKKRIAGIYKTCKWELANNKDLSSQDRKELEDHIDSIEKIYDDFVFTVNDRNFVYQLWARLTRQTIENQDIQIEKNVLQVLKDLEADQKFKKKNLERTNVNQEDLKIKKAVLTNAMLNVVSSMKTGLMGHIAGLFESETKTL